MCAPSSRGIFTDSAAERVKDIKHDDLAGDRGDQLAQPTRRNHRECSSTKVGRHTWCSRPNPNLPDRRTVPKGLPVPEQARRYRARLHRPGATITYERDPSSRDRYILRDGYHRALGLLGPRASRRCRCSCARWRRLSRLPLPGMLPQDAYLGERPPLLRDYRDMTP